MKTFDTRSGRVGSVLSADSSDVHPNLAGDGLGDLLDLPGRLIDRRTVVFDSEIFIANAVIEDG